MDDLLAIRLGRPDLVEAQGAVTTRADGIGIGASASVGVPMVGQIGLTYLLVATAAVAAFYIATRSRQY